MSKFEIDEKMISSDNLFVLTDDNYFTIDWNKVSFNDITLVVSENANVKVLEIGNKCNRNVKYIIKSNATLKLNICSLENAFENSYNFSLDDFSNAEVAYADFDQGTKLCKMNFDLYGNESNVKWHLASLTTANDKKEFDVSFNHNGLGTTALMNSYGVCENDSSLTFSGIGTIKNGAKRTKTRQSAKIMVFDENCSAKACPILKIDENDVEASHAASVGKVSDEHLFYLCSRGISEEDAKRLITLGYLNPIIAYFEEEEISSAIAEAIERRV